MNKRTQAIMDSVRAQRALADTDNELRATVTDYDAKMAYHAELMEAMFKDSNPDERPRSGGKVQTDRGGNGKTIWGGGVSPFFLSPGPAAGGSSDPPPGLAGLWVEDPDPIVPTR